MKRVVLRGGPPVHPLVYSKRVYQMDRGIRDGDLVAVEARGGEPCGFALVHTHSQIALRMLSFSPEIVPDDAWIEARLVAADALRRDVLDLPAVTNAWRIVHAEADGMPGLIVDRYDDVVVFLLYSLGWYRKLDVLERIARERLGAREVRWVPDHRTAEREGLPLEAPKPPIDVRVEEHGVGFRVAAGGGHKSGFFLDQRANRARVARLAKGRDVFDGMTYTGGFALAAAAGGAASVRGMDLDERAVEQARTNAKDGGLPATFAHGDVYHALRDLAGQPPAARPDLLIIDPPKWARDRKGVGVALAKYHDLNRLAFQAVRPGGLVFTHSCSGLVDEPTFLRVLRGASLDTRIPVRVLEIHGAAADHPVALHAPEGRYLKSVLVAVGHEGEGPGGDEEREARTRDAGPPPPRRDDRPAHRGGGSRGPGRGPRRPDAGPRRDDGPRKPRRPRF